MEKSGLDQQYAGICSSLAGGKIKAALEGLSRYSKNVPSVDYHYRLETLEDNYRNLLKYAFEGYRDPRQEEILNGLALSVLTLADEIRHTLKEKELVHTRAQRMQVQREFGEDPSVINDRIDSLIFGREVERILRETGAGEEPGSPVELLFTLIWLTPKWSDDFYEKIRSMLRSEKLEWHEKSLIVSAATLSLFDFFEPRKLILLMEAIESREPQSYHRALTGLVLALVRYEERLKFYPEVLARIKELVSLGTVRSDMESVLLQILMAQETERINKAFEEEVLPGMRQVMPRLEDKLDLGNIFEENDPEGKNPGWKELMDEVPGLFERIEKFTKMQMEGADVFMSTFSMLKKFDFFNRITNWFVPFYPGHPDLKKATGEEGQFFARLLAGLGKAFYLCNSDKYSFALNFNAVPQQQRSMIITYFEAELEQMKEMVSEEELLGQTESSHTVFTQYIQDLYRFFRLFAYRNEFEDPFRNRIRLIHLPVYPSGIGQEKFLERIAAFYFDKGHYREAIEMYERIIEVGQPQGEYFEKIGYGWQKLGEFRKAIEYFKKAELFDTDRLWILKKIGWCFLRLEDYANAIPHFKDAAALRPDDMNIQAHLGQCFIATANFEQALHHYKNVLYFQPDNPKVLRPIAYCLFASGKLDDSSGIYEKILASGDPLPYDLMNAGHVQLCRGNRKEAIRLYRQSVSGKTLILSSFRTAFEEDVPFLTRNGIAVEDIPLLTDSILYLLDENSK
jgi:tetratricopeptide (TPR) repeat protein